MRKIAFSIAFLAIMVTVLAFDYRDQHERLELVTARVDGVERTSENPMQHMDLAWVQGQRAVLRAARADVSGLRDSWLGSEKAALLVRIDNLDERLESHEQLVALLHREVGAPTAGGAPTEAVLRQALRGGGTGGSR